jgi:hypothetical protein
VSAFFRQVLAPQFLYRQDFPKALGLYSSFI